jgi:hypothetical protein
MAEKRQRYTRHDSPEEDIDYRKRDDRRHRERSRSPHHDQRYGNGARYLESRLLHNLSKQALTYLVTIVWWLTSPFLATDAKDILETETISVVTIGAEAETGIAHADPMNINEEIQLIVVI